MTASIVGAGPIYKDVDRSESGHRIYKVIYKVKVNSVLDGPQVVMNTPGLPTIGSFWNFGNDVDLFAFCMPTMRVTPLKKQENKYWLVEQEFKSEGPTGQSCDQQQIDDPLLEPPKVSGSFVKYTVEATQDRFGTPIASSSHELFRGPQVEFDANRPTVRIEMNLAELGLSTFSQMVDTVNSTPMWGLTTRRVKLSNVSWERKLLGTCFFYYTLVFDFDISYDGFDREIIDEGTKVLKGRWNACNTWDTVKVGNPPADPDPNNPNHFIRAHDCNLNPIRVLLDGAGKPLTDYDDPYVHSIQYYGESDFFVLGIPTEL